jgi:hypothetical protein
MDERNDRASLREAAFARAERVKRWVAGGALALTGIFSAIAAAVLPASHASSAAPSPTQTPAVSSEDETGNDSQSQSQTHSRSVQPQPVTPDISPPAAVPQPSDSGGGAVSGGS